MRIIDAHAHLGVDVIDGFAITAQTLIATMDAHQIDVSIVQPLPNVTNPRNVHDEIAELAQGHPGRIFGMACMNPRRPDYLDEVERCVGELGFVGIKLHTMHHLISPLSEDATAVFAIASGLGVPLMIHTGTSIPFSLPSLCGPRAAQYPRLEIVLAHAGTTAFAQEAYTVACEHDNVYLETSWCSVYKVKWFLEKLGAERAMFGCDLPLNVAVEVAKSRQIKLTDKQRRQYLGGTAARVFSLPIH